MRVREVFHSRLAKLLRVDGITLYPFIFYAGVPDERLRRHEWEHVAQVRHYGWFRFYASYLWEYFIERVWYRKSHRDAYQYISHEVNAYAAQADGQKPWLEG